MNRQQEQAILADYEWQPPMTPEQEAKRDKVLADMLKAEPYWRDWRVRRVRAEIETP